MKKRNVFLLGLLVVLLAMGLVLAGCGDDDSGDTGGNDSGSNNSGGQNSGGQNGGGATTGTVIIENRTGLTITQIALYKDSNLVQSFNVNVPNGGNYTITNVPPGNNYYLMIYNGDYDGSSTFSIYAGQTQTWTAR